MRYRDHVSREKRRVGINRLCNATLVRNVIKILFYIEKFYIGRKEINKIHHMTGMQGNVIRKMTKYHVMHLIQSLENYSCPKNRQVGNTPASKIHFVYEIIRLYHYKDNHQILKPMI